MVRFGLVSALLLLLSVSLLLSPSTSKEDDTCDVAASKLGAGYNIQCNNTNCIPCELNQNPDPNRRRRYEIRDLPPNHWDSFVFALKEMHNLTMEEGTAKYGPLFKNTVYMVAFHIFAADSSRGEQAHFGAHFLPFHSALTSMYETIVLTITKKNGLPLESTPYWWHFNDTDQADLIGPDYFGTFPGKGENYEITDGQFANWTIPLYNETYQEFMSYAADPYDITYEGNAFGFLREAKSKLFQKTLVGYPMGAEMNHSSNYVPTPLERVVACLECGYDALDYNIFHFAWCVQERWHTWVHAGLGGWRFDENGEVFGGDFAGEQANAAPMFIPFHNSIDMFYIEWISSHPEYANTSWGYPYDRPYNYLEKRSYEGIAANDTINAAFPIHWKDVGWALPYSTDANNTVTYLEAMCYYTKENVDYVYVKFSGSPDHAPGEILENRDFETYDVVNGESNHADEAEADREANKATLLPAAESFLAAYDTASDNRLEAAEAFLESLTTAAGVRE